MGWYLLCSLQPSSQQVALLDRLVDQFELTNLNEALKDMNTASELTVKSERAKNSHLLISVSDTGIGLAPQQTDEIFNAFYTTKPDGTGMGSPISRSIIASHGGRLWAAPNQPRGAVFLFMLPAENDELHM